MGVEKVIQYYSTFDEWNRLSTPEGMLEFKLIHRIIDNHIKIGSKVLDLGGGPGRHTIELAKKGYVMSLGDLSPDLIKIAKEKAKGINNIESIDVVNSVDLTIYKDGYFDAVLCFGPLYHLTDDNDVYRSLIEINRILKPGGQILAIYMPYLSGINGIIERSIRAPEQVDSLVLDEVFKAGIFHNKVNSGFQEGRLLKSNEIENMMEKAGYIKIQIRSIRGLGYRLEKGIIEKEIQDKKLFDKIIKIIEESSTYSELVDTNGHAIYIGRKPK
jgi:ubiquinone/menaquinone biosynthesis C-methylase UbiE